MNNNEEVLSLKFKICDNVKHKINTNGIVTLIEKQDHKIQNFLRKFKFKIPIYKEIELDEYCSTVFIMLNGEHTIKEIGEILNNKYGDRIYPLYERLLVFINYIYIDCRYIEIIK